MSNITLMVCPHDTASNPDKWFHFAQYLSKNLANSVNFDKCMDFGEFHQKLTNGGFIYANPQDSLRLIQEHGYTPIARSSNLFDEIVFIANSGIENPTLSDFNDNHVVSVNSMMVTRVGVKHLFENNIKPAAIHSKDSWMAVVKGIFRQEDEYALVYKDFYDGLNSLSKSGLKMVGQTQDGTIYHSILIAPELKKMAPDLQQCLLGMDQESNRSRSILSNLGVDQFIEVNSEDILKFNDLASLGSDLMVTKEALAV